jgi:phage gpG-like protein
VFIELDIDTKRCFERLAPILVSLVDMGPAWFNVYRVIQKVVEQNFMAGGRPKWEPRKKDTGEYNGPLRRSKDLYRAATNPVLDAKSDRGIYSARVGIKGRVHHYGFQGTVTVQEHNRTIYEAFGLKLAQSKTFKVEGFEMKMNIPARPFFGIPSGYGDENRIKSAIWNWVFRSESNIEEFFEGGAKY